MHNDVYCRQTVNYSKHSSVNFAYFQHLSTTPCLPSALCLFKNLFFISCGNISVWRLLEHTVVTLILLLFLAVYIILTTITLNYVGECCKSAAHLLFIILFIILLCETSISMLGPYAFKIRIFTIYQRNQVSLIMCVTVKQGSLNLDWCLDLQWYRISWGMPSGIHYHIQNIPNS